MYNFTPAAPDEEHVFGACRPTHPRHAPTGDTVEDWLAFMDKQGIQRVCCLLDDQHLAEHDDLLTRYEAHFGAEKVCHAPIGDFTVIYDHALSNSIMPFLETAVERTEPVVVHCSAGSGRTGHVLALWLVHGRGYDLADAIAAVEKTGRDPLEAASQAELNTLVESLSTSRQSFLGIAPQHILEHDSTSDPWGGDNHGGLQISHNQTDPTVICDGIDYLTVIEEAADRYRIEYGGYLAGTLRVTRPGIAELGKQLLTDRPPVPRWLLETDSPTEALPWWVPEDYDGEPVLPCTRCGIETPAGEILTPGSMDGYPEEMFCRDCWDGVRGR